MHRERIVSLLFACSMALLSGTAAAQETEGHLQLALMTDLLVYSTATVENDDSGIEVDTSILNWGIRDNVALEVGYGLSEMLVLGVFFRLGGQTITLEPASGAETETSEFAVQVGPKLDVVFGGRQSEVRPFVGAAVALESTTLREEDAGIETSVLGVNLQGRVGVHWFVVPGFSIDPMFAVTWGTGSGEVDEIDGNDSVDVSATGLSVGLMLGASGWIP